MSAMNYKLNTHNPYWLLAGLMLWAYPAQAAHPKPGVIVRLPSGSAAPTIDGEIDAVYKLAKGNPMTNSVMPVGEPNKLTGPDDCSASWYGLWDDNYVYFLVDVKDDKFVIDNGGADWLDDALRTWNTPDNNLNPIWEDDNDWAYECPLNGTKAFAPPHYEPSNTKLDSKFKIKGGTGSGYTGWTYEMRIPFSEWKLTTPKMGDSVSVEFEVDDDDDNGNRDSKLMWWSDENSLVSKYDASAIGVAYYAADSNFTVSNWFTHPAKKNWEIHPMGERAQGYLNRNDVILTADGRLLKQGEKSKRKIAWLPISLEVSRK